MNVIRHRDAPVKDLTLRAKRCQHRYIATAKDITANIVSNRGHPVFSGDTEGVFKKYSEVEYCTNRTCDRVFYAEEMK